MACCKPTGVQGCYWNPAAALRVATFDSHAVIANPIGLPLGTGLSIIHDGSYFGPSFLTFGCGAQNVIFDLIYTRPRDRVMQIRVHSQGGNDLTDGDGIASCDVQLFDVNNVALTPVFTAAGGNGGAPVVTNVPGAPVNGVAKMRVTNIICLFAGANVPGSIRELELMQQGLSPAAAIWCCDEGGVQWVDATTGATVATSDLTDCR